MRIANVFGIIMICLGLYLGYIGANKLSNNTNEINFLGLKIDASNEKGQTKGIIFLVGAVILVGGGVVALRRK